MAGKVIECRHNWRGESYLKGILCIQPLGCHLSKLVLDISQYKWLGVLSNSPKDETACYTTGWLESSICIVIAQKPPYMNKQFSFLSTGTNGNNAHNPQSAYHNNTDPGDFEASRRRHDLPLFSMIQLFAMTKQPSDQTILRLYPSWKLWASWDFFVSIRIWTYPQCYKRTYS